MYCAKIENASGDALILTGREPEYQIISINGLNPPKAQINTATIVGLDGAVFNSAKLETRNIVLLIKINGEAEANRHRLYQFFRTKESCRFFFRNGALDVFIDGYVENVECDLFEQGQTAQVSIICPYPYFRSVSESVSDSVSADSQFVFPFSINYNEPVILSTYIDSGAVLVYNESESEAGAVIEIDLMNDASSIELRNTATGDDFILEHAFTSGDKIIVDTNKGKKSVTLMRNGRTSNIFSALVRGSVFFQLVPGVNVFDYLIDGEQDADVYISFRYFNTYRGV